MYTSVWSDGALRIMARERAGDPAGSGPQGWKGMKTIPSWPQIGYSEGSSYRLLKPSKLSGSGKKWLWHKAMLEWLPVPQGPPMGSKGREALLHWPQAPWQPPSQHDSPALALKAPLLQPALVLPL
mmetsp:Transcript_50150/g.108963  ORF Transcript_50150/g.108963 Transcript_50150/m.108963 type:complete len:126 (-) Transcript_50150:1119-1496(-)